MGLNNFWSDVLELEEDADVNEAAEGEGIGMSSSAVN